MFQYTILDQVKRPFVIYKNIFENKYCLDPQRGNISKHSMVISLPRSGVHLIQDILTTIGLTHVRVSHTLDSIQDYRFLTDTDRINFSRMHDTYTFPINETYKWVINGQFVHNHLPYDDTTYCLLRESEYSMYILKRNLRDCIVSHAKHKMCLSNTSYNMSKIMSEYIKMPYYLEISEMTKIMLPWFENKTFDELTYETLVGLNGKDKQYQQIMRLLEDFNITNIQSDEIINKCINKKNFTDWKTCWSDEIEKWFDKIGLLNLNRLLGYS